MDIHGRRDCLNVEHEQAATIDYIVSLSGTCTVRGFQGSISLEVLYVPDRAVLRPVSFQAYLAALGDDAWQTLEALATTALEDLNNELIPRWLMVNAEHSSSVDAIERDTNAINSHRVMLEDRRPKWDNPTLLSRLRSF